MKGGDSMSMRRDTLLDIIVCCDNYDDDDVDTLSSDCHTCKYAVVCRHYQSFIHCCTLMYDDNGKFA